VLIDFDHRADDVETPMRLQGLITSPIRIGARARLRKGCVVQRGVTIGAGAEVGHHAVVTRDVPPGVRVEGVPARPAAAAS
jgi:acetyltransferase-like isoleucine patch superfamily enzyme